MDMGSAVAHFEEYIERLLIRSSQHLLEMIMVARPEGVSFEYCCRFEEAFHFWMVRFELRKIRDIQPR